MSRLRSIIRYIGQISLPLVLNFTLRNGAEIDNYDIHGMDAVILGVKGLRLNK